MSSPLAAVAPNTAQRHLGRFEIIRVLGKGVQGTVYLARDPHLGRDVAVKTLRIEHMNASSRSERVRALLDEARIVSKLQHPNIVTLYDAGEEDGNPYLVFEYVEGLTLEALIREKGTLPCAQAADIAQQVLRGIALAHAKGVFHRDLKPANIILTTDGIPRVMDFGIARLASDMKGGEEALFGTPSYMAPEYITSRPYTALSDLFGLGMMLYEMLTGQPAVKTNNMYETLHRIVNVPFPPPNEINPDVDEGLTSLVMRAIAKDPKARFESAEKMAEALAVWLEPLPEAPATGAQGTLDFLLRRMRHKSDFPALSTTMSNITHVLGSDRQHANVLCNTILRDFALTNKILKLVNAAYYNQFGGTIRTISRAVTILGLETIRNVAMSLMLFEHLQNKSQAIALRDELAATYFSGVLAREFVQQMGIRDAEEAFICAMFRRLGALLAKFYLYDEVQAIERLMQSRNIDEAPASTQVLGISYDELGAGVAENWKFPKTIVNSMSPLAEGVRSRPQFENEKLRVLSDLANNLCNVVRMEHPLERESALLGLVAKYSEGIGVTVEKLVSVIRQSVTGLVQDAEFLGFNAGKSPFFETAVSWIREPAPQAAADPNTQVAAATQLDIVSPTEPFDAAAEAASRKRETVLAAGVQDIINTLVSDHELNDVLRIILETMYRGIGFTRVLLCVSDANHTALRARFGFGPDVDELVSSGFSIPLKGPRDVFYAAVTKGVDIRVEDIDAGSIRNHVPAWYRNAIKSRGMVLFPVMLKERPVALIYADTEDPATLRFRPEELNLLKALRNQAVLAFKQKR